MTEYDAIYLSPHLDDAALSCGAQIFDRRAAGQSVLVVTIAAGNPPQAPISPFAQLLHDRWALSNDAVVRRRQEDAVACDILGADYLHWDIPDCIYRLHPETGEPLYAAESALFDVLHPAEEGLVAALAQRLADLPAHKAVIGPLAIGNHVDHQLTRAAAARCFGMALSYYEDYPYVRWETAVSRAIPADKKGWQEKVVPVSEAGIEARIAAIATFVSQVGTFFNGRADLVAQIRSQIQAVGGERLWRQINP